MCCISAQTTKSETTLYKESGSEAGLLHGEKAILGEKKKDFFLRALIEKIEIENFSISKNFENFCPEKFQMNFLL